MSDNTQKGDDLRESREWVIYGALILVALTCLALWSSSRFEPYIFNDVTAEAIWSLLFPLFIIAVFLERAQEVFITTWRGIGGANLEAKVKRAKGAKDGESLAEAEAQLHTFKHRTKRYAFIAGVSGGVLISVAGVRVLNPLMNWDIEYTNAQKIVFNLVDVFLTGGLIGGGSDGIHKVMSVILDFMDHTRDRMTGAPEKPDGS